MPRRYSIDIEGSDIDFSADELEGEFIVPKDEIKFAEELWKIESSFFASVRGPYGIGRQWAREQGYEV
jgi:hypothetical protein